MVPRILKIPPSGFSRFVRGSGASTQDPLQLLWRGEGLALNSPPSGLFHPLPAPEDSPTFLSERVLVSVPHSPSLGSIVFPAPDRCALWYPVPGGQLSPLTLGALWGSRSTRTHPSDKEVPCVMEREEGPYPRDPSFHSFFWNPDSLRPQGLWPARLLCTWDSPGKNTGVGCHFLLHVKLLSHVRLFAILWTITYQAPPSMEFSRQESWSRLPLPSPGDPSRLRDQTQVSCIAGRRFTI